MVSERARKRYYTVGEANAQVDRLSELFGRVMQLRAQLKAIYQRLDEAGFAPTQEQQEDPEGDEDDKLPADVERDRRLFFGMAEALKEQVEAILATGCVIKDIEVGLVDWLASHHGREIWLCWKYGERQVEFWHELTSGFDSRRPVSELEC
jgi:hypothetical protein